MDPCPDAMVVVDVGHSYTHAVPVVQGAAQWNAAQRYAPCTHPRLDMGGKVLTHLLKVMFSYRQWNMMDETYLIDKMKAASCFVAARSEPRAYRRGDEPRGPPSSWSFEQFVEHFQYVATPNAAATRQIPWSSNTCSPTMRHLTM